MSVFCTELALYTLLVSTGAIGILGLCHTEQVFSELVRRVSLSMGRHIIAKRIFDYLRLRSVFRSCEPLYLRFQVIRKSYRKHSWSPYYGVYYDVGRRQVNADAMAHLVAVHFINGTDTER